MKNETFSFKVMEEMFSQIYRKIPSFSKDKLYRFFKASRIRPFILDIPFPFENLPKIKRSGIYRFEISQECYIPGKQQERITAILPSLHLSGNYPALLISLCNRNILVSHGFADDIGRNSFLF